MGGGITSVTKYITPFASSIVSTRALPPLLEQQPSISVPTLRRHNDGFSFLAFRPCRTSASSTLAINMVCWNSILYAKSLILQLSATKGVILPSVRVSTYRQ